MVKKHVPWQTVFLGLGSNIGCGRTNIKRARHLLDAAFGIRVGRISRIIFSRPQYRTDQADFANAVMKVRTRLEPTALLHAVKGIERAMGRTPGRRYGPRIIDIDILLYGSRSVCFPHLKIPHRRMLERSFVMLPLAEIAPGTVHPGERATIRRLSKTFRSGGMRQIL